MLANHLSGCSFLPLLLIAVTSANYTKTAWEHPCDPGSEVFACSVPNFLYHPYENYSSLIAPDTVQKVRLGYPTDKKIVSRETITAYDEVLHMVLKRPKAIQIAYASIKQLDIPYDLEYADFRGNSIQTVHAPALKETEYALRFLDLQHNDLDRIECLQALVNL
uniref:Leucine rich immune protein (Coil-less) n=1 Tax=Anopheles maculatus TaxID=74869 RepID=A0A182SJB5_9DIPT